MSKIIPIKEIHNLLFRVASLSQEQKDLVQKELSEIRADGISKQEFELMLRRLRKEYKISEIDRQGIEEAFASYFI